MKNLSVIAAFIAITLLSCTKQASNQPATQESKKSKGSSIVLEATAANLPIAIPQPDLSGDKIWKYTFINWLDSAGVKVSGAAIFQEQWNPNYILEWNNTAPFNNTCPSGTWTIQVINYTYDPATDEWAELRYGNITDVIVP